MYHIIKEIEGAAMGKFDGVLIVSDYDGTWYSGSTYPQNNAEAVKYFISEGGRFCISSGRCKTHLKWVLEGVPYNAPCTLCNGAHIFDYDEDRTYYESFLPASCKHAIQSAVNKFDDVWFEVIAQGGELIYTPKNLQGEPQSGASERRFFDSFAEVPEGWQKILFSGENAKLKEIEAYLEGIINDEVYLIFTSPNLLEVCAAGVDKGSGLLRLEKLLGTEHKNVYAVGDFYNDIEMIGAAGVGCAVGGCIGELIDAADIVLCHPREGAIADLISRLDALPDARERNLLGK